MHRLQSFVLIILAIIAVYFGITKRFHRSWTLESDLGVTYVYARELLNLKNPYSVYMEKKHLTEKAPPYFPLSYIFIAFIDKVFGTKDFFEFLSVWFTFTWLNNIWVAILLSYFVYVTLRKQSISNPILISIILGFGFISQPLILKKSVEQFDIISFSLTLTSLLFVRFNKPIIAAVFFGLSISFKQTFIFVVPFYFFYLYKKFYFHKTLLAIASFALTISIFYIPFLYSDFTGTLYCTILFHILREGVRDFLKYSVPYISYFIPKYLHPGVLLYFLSLVSIVKCKLPPQIGFLLPAATFMLFHKYPLEQYLLAIFLCGIVGFVWQNCCEESCNKI